MYAACQTDFNLGRHLVSYLQEVPFFAELSRQLRKVPTRDIPTLAVSYNVKLDEAVMYYNPEFLERQSNWQVRGGLNHEFYHLTFGHLNARIKKPAKLWNIGTDLAINSIIMQNAKSFKPRDADDNDVPLPYGGLIPGQWPVHPTGRPLTSTEKEASRLGALISTFPETMASEFYFNKLLEEQQKNEDDDGGGDDYLDSFDDHSMWDDVPEDSREYVEGRIKSMIEKAVKFADSTPSGWGNMPEYLQREIRLSLSTIINWRLVLRQFIGTLVRGDRTSSIKRINKRFPYIHPGTKRNYVAKLLIAIDQSYSVDDEMLNEFFNELASLTKRVTVDILHFDSGADVKEVYTWKKGTRPALLRTRAGGTNFDAPTNVLNDPKNRGRWDGMLVMTDGECSAPGPSRIKRGWVIGKGQKLLFPTSEIVITLDNTNPMSGAWR